MLHRLLDKRPRCTEPLRPIVMDKLLESATDMNNWAVTTSTAVKCSGIAIDFLSELRAVLSARQFCQYETCVERIDAKLLELLTAGKPEESTTVSTTSTE